MTLDDLASAGGGLLHAVIISSLSIPCCYKLCNTRTALHASLHSRQPFQHAAAVEALQHLIC